MSYHITSWAPWNDPQFTYFIKLDGASEFTPSSKTAFENDTSRRILQYIEMYKVKKGQFKNKKIKVIYKGKYKASNDKKNGRPKPWQIAIKGKGLSTADATNIYNNTPWLIKIVSRMEIWEPLPAGLIVPGWYGGFEQYGGMLDVSGSVEEVLPEITGLTINWESHDPGNPLEQTESEIILSILSCNFAKLKASGKAHDVLYEWSVNGTVKSSGESSSINIIANEHTTGDVISLRCFLGDLSSSTGVWKDVDETITLNITPLPVIEVPDDPGDKAAVTTDDGISLEAEVEGVDGNKTLDFDGIENVNMVATKNDVTVKNGGDVIPEENTSIELSGGLDPLPPVVLPDESEDDYILLRFNPTNEVIIPIMEWYELKLGPNIEIDWDYTGDGDVETFNLESAVPIPVDNVNTDMSSYFGQHELNHYNDRAPVPAPIEWTEHENWNTTQPVGPDGWVWAKLGWSMETVELSNFRRDILDNSKRISFDLNSPSAEDKTVGYVGAWKRWSGPARPRTVLIRTKNMVKRYGFDYYRFNDRAVPDMITESNSKLNFIKIKGCGNVTNWSYSFGTIRTYTPISPSYTPEAMQEALRPDLVVDMTQLIVDRCTSFNQMFSCSRIKEIDLSTLNSLPIDCDFAGMFLRCSRLESAKLPESYKIVHDSNNVLLINMFYECTSLTTIDLTPLNQLFKYRASMGNMFYKCTSLSSVDMTDISFYGCDFTRMFDTCTSLETVVGWNTVSSLIWNIQNMPTDMFRNCSKLTSNMINNFNNWILVEDAWLSIGAYSPSIDTAAVNKWISDGWEIASNSGITATIDTSNIRKRGDSDCIISNKTFSSPNWSNSLQLDIDLNLSPDRHHEKSWTNGTDMSSYDEEFFNVIPWDKNTVEIGFGSGVGYNQNIFDVMIDWGDGIIERHSSFNGGTDDRYIDSEYYAQKGRVYYQTGHTIVTHKYISSGKKKTIKILGFCTDSLSVGWLPLQSTRQINGSNQYYWMLPNMKFVLKGIKSVGSPRDWSTSSVKVDTFNLSVAPASISSCSRIEWDDGLFWLNAEPYDNIIENVASKFADWFKIDKFTESWLTFGGVEEWPDSENSKYTLVDGAPKRSWITYENGARFYSSKGYMNVNGDMVWHRSDFNSNAYLAHARHIDTILNNWILTPGDRQIQLGSIWNNTAAYGNGLYYRL